MTTLNGALPELRAAYDKLVAYGKQNGIGVALADFGGVRTLADTTKILEYRDTDFAAAVRNGTIAPDTTLQAFRPIAPFGSSYHNYGAAFDVRIASRPASMSVYAAQKLLGAYAPKIGLRWGGTFRNPDNPHFELAVSLADAQRMYRAAFPSSATPGTVFDLTALLSGTTPSNDEAAEFPDVYTPGDDSGVQAVDYPNEPPVAMIALGLFVAGVVAWALRRKFFA